MFRLPMKIAASSTSAAMQDVFSATSRPNLNAADKTFLYTCGLTGAGTIGSGLYFASGVPRSDKARFFAAGALLVPTAMSTVFCPPAMGPVIAGFAGLSAALLHSARQERKSKISAQQLGQTSQTSPRP